MGWRPSLGADRLPKVCTVALGRAPDELRHKRMQWQRFELDIYLIDMASSIFLLMCTYRELHALEIHHRPSFLHYLPTY